MLLLGVTALIASIIFTSTTNLESMRATAFIGLGLVFWGTILLYVQKSDYIPTEILDASTPAFTSTLDQIIQALDYQGTPVYLPPSYFENPEDTKIFIPKQKEGPYPAPEQTQRNKNLLMHEPPGILLTPPGEALTKLLEKTLETSFTRIDIQYLEQHLPKLLIEDLEIATDFKIQTPNVSQRSIGKASQTKPGNNAIQVKIATTAYQNTLKQAAQHPFTTARSLPLTSSIAIAIAKASGKPTTIQIQEISENGKTMTVEYRLIESGPTDTESAKTGPVHKEPAQL